MRRRRLAPIRCYAREGGREGAWLPALRRAAATMSEREPQTRVHATSRASSCPQMTPIPIEHLNHVQGSPGSERGRLRCRAAVLRPLPPNLSASFLHQLVGDESQSRGGHGAHSLTHLRTCTFRSIHSPGEGGCTDDRLGLSLSQSAAVSESLMRDQLQIGAGHATPRKEGRRRGGSGKNESRTQNQPSQE